VALSFTAVGLKQVLETTLKIRAKSSSGGTATAATVTLVGRKIPPRLELTMGKYQNASDALARLINQYQDLQAVWEAVAEFGSLDNLFDELTNRAWQT
jgi:hypothetical protein